MRREIFLPLEVDFADGKRVVKLARYGKDARAVRDLLVQMWCYCKSEMSDGHVPLEQVGKLVYPDAPRIGQRDADRLVAVGLAERTDDGYFFPGYLKRNKSRAEIEAMSAAKVEAGSESGSYGNHVRWHVNEGKCSTACDHCRNIGSRSGQPDRVGSGGDRTEDRGQRTEDRDQGITQVGGAPSSNATSGRATKPPRCKAHENQAHDPGPCRGCMRARQAAEAEAIEHEARTKAEAITAKAQCTLCDPDGWRLDAEQLPTGKKCNHRSTP